MQICVSIVGSFNVNIKLIYPAMGFLDVIFQLSIITKLNSNRMNCAEMLGLYALSIP